MSKIYKELKRPDWIKVKSPGLSYNYTKDLIYDLKLNTVCQEAGCPNIGECWSKKHAAFMILGSICTRACRFCDVKKGKPQLLDPHEPQRLANAVKDLGLKHVVITSVDRDDLEDGGAQHFAECIMEIRNASPTTTIEVLTPDFLKKDGALEKVVKARPDVYNHNIETVPSLYRKIRPRARYYHSLNLLHNVKKLDSTVFTKSGLMVGLGETNDEIIQVIDDLRAARVDFLTIGQYLQPSSKHEPIHRFMHPDEFKYLEKISKTKGFLLVSSSPLTRSSYHADEDFIELKKHNSFFKFLA